MTAIHPKAVISADRTVDPIRGVNHSRRDLRAELLLDALPSLAVIAFILEAQLDRLLPSVVLKLPPAPVLVIAVWLVSSLILRRTVRLAVPPHFVVLAACTAIWLFAATFVSVDYVRSLQWTVVIIIAFFGFVTGGTTANLRARKMLHVTIIAAGSLVGGLSIIEGTFKISIFYGQIADGALVPGSQHWSTFRSYISFNHPLIAGTVLASFCIYALFSYVVSVHNSGVNYQVVSAVLAGAGAVFTVSRSAMLALGIAFLLGCVTLFGKRSPKTGRLTSVIVVSVGIAAYILLYSPVAGRSQTAEGTNSALFRTEVFDLIGPLSKSFNYMGSGPDTAQSWAYATGYHRLLENSLVQILVSVGVVGVVLFAASFFAILRISIKNRNTPAFAAIVALISSSSAFGVLETYPAIFVLFGAYGLMSTGPVPNSGTSVITVVKRQ